MMVATIPLKLLQTALLYTYDGERQLDTNIRAIRWTRETA